MKCFFPFLFILYFGQALSQEEIAIKNEVNHFSHDLGTVYYGWGQSPKGKMYLATQRGLSFFDGKKEHIYQHDGRGKSIENIVFDKDGILWCNTFKGDVFYLENDSLVKHPISKELDGLIHLYSFAGKVYLAHERSFYVLNGRKKYQLITKRTKSIRICTEYQDKIFLITETEKGIELYDIKNKKETLIDIGNLVFGNYHDVYWNGKKSVYFTVSNSLVSFESLLGGDLKIDKTFDYPSKITNVTAVEDQLFISGFNGLFVYGSSSSYPKHILPGVQFSQTGKDLEGNIISTTLTNGLLNFSSLEHYFIDYSKILNGEKIFSIENYKNNYLFIGSNSGLLIRHDLQKQTLDTLRFGYRGEISAMAIDETNQKLYLYSDSLFVIDVFSLKISSRYNLNALKVVKKNGAEYYLGCSRCLYKFSFNSTPEMLINGYWITGIHDIPEGILFSSNKGMFYLNESDEIIPVDYAGIDFKKHLSRFEITKSGKTYFVHDFSRLYEFNSLEKEPKVIYERSEKDIHSIRAVGNDLYLFLEDGLIVFNSIKKTHRFFDETDGLFSNKCLDVINIKNKNYVFHEQTVSVFKKLREVNTFIPQIELHPSIDQTFSFNNRRWTSDYNHNILSFTVNILPNIRGRGKGTFYYRIPKISTEWVHWEGKINQIRLERLPIGVYDIELMAKNEDGIKSDILVIPVQVLPPFYLSWWFILSSILLLIFIIILVIRTYIRKIKKKNFEKLKKERLETRALNAELKAIRSQMNPHFIFNVLTAIQAKVISGKSDDAYQNIADFAVLIRNVLEKSGKENISLRDEIELIKTYVKLENSRMNEPVILDITIDSKIDADQLLVPTLITQPFIENSFKHGFKGIKKDKSIHLDVNNIANGFEIIIKDNGIGFEVNNSFDNDHNSFALKALKKRLQKISMGGKYLASYEIESDLGKGTCVIINFTFI